MLANVSCWVIAIALLFSENLGRDDMYVKFLLAIGFIFVGTLSKAVDTYRITHSKKSDEKKDEKSITWS